jgi:aminoglycoside phosphotransferase family enzyme/predicted kinase
MDLIIGSERAARMKSGKTLLTDGVDKQRALVQALMNPQAYPHPVNEVTLLETHISFVLLTGRFAYKIKKAVNLGFLDFTRLEQRRFYCDEELRLNRRLAPDLYLAVVPIGSSMHGVQIGSSASPVEYAVKMAEFPQSALLDRCLSEGKLSTEQIDVLAERVAVFHMRMPRAGATDDYGTPATVWDAVSQSFAQLRTGLPAIDADGAELALLDELKAWSRDEYARLRSCLSIRKHDGFVRECHGDLHLGNIAWLDDAPKIFDGIEFNPSLRWIDVMSEIAFLVMDLDERGQPGLAHLFLNRYLESTGDYRGLRVLPFYQAYRALVRAKVAGIRAEQAETENRRVQADICARYLACARRISLPQGRCLLLMHGFSGSGKTTVSQRVVESLGAVRVRSDIERKRLCGLPALARGGAAADRGIYDAGTTQATYQRLVQQARRVLEAGFPVVVDAASLKSWQREIFRSQARTQGVPFRILGCRADESVLRQRLHGRKQAGDDASDADAVILQHQLRSSEPLAAEELDDVWFVDDMGDSLDRTLCKIKEVMR